MRFVPLLFLFTSCCTSPHLTESQVAIEKEDLGIILLYLDELKKRADMCGRVICGIIIYFIHAIQSTSSKCMHTAYCLILPDTSC